MEAFAFEVDEMDAGAIHAAIARRQKWQVIPDGEGSMQGRLIAEICRGWMELHDGMELSIKGNEFIRGDGKEDSL